MPQITVTLDEDVYVELIHNLPKGLKSKFVNRAVRKALSICQGYGSAMHDYARKGEHAALEKSNMILEMARENKEEMEDRYQAALNPNQQKLGVEESENEKWIREQKEALEWV